jgi:hypothetical protein
MPVKLSGMSDMEPDARLAVLGKSVLKAASGNPLAQARISQQALDPSRVGTHFATSFRKTRPAELMAFRRAEVRPGSSPEAAARLPESTILDWLETLSPDDLSRHVQAYVDSPRGLRNYERLTALISGLSEAVQMRAEMFGDLGEGLK